VPDIGFERTLTGLRRFLLSMAVRDEAERHWAFTNPELIYALAQHCFLNGYVFAESDEEVDKFNSLIAELSARKLTTSRFDRARVGVVACYVRLLDWDKAAEIWESANEDPDPDYSQMLMKQIENPIHELQLREVIPGVGDITDEVSKKVQSLYEEHPYPRWESYSRVQPKPVEAVVRDLFPDFHLERLEVGDPPKILVAGCGTGKQLMLAWSRFHNAELVGIDLSVSSLAYALRKLKENSIENVALIHGDILDLKEWSEPLDVIECVGVLHHMDDPLEGWRILSHLLKPGGLMRIGLYSSLARREIANVREFIAKLGLEATEEDIRRGRQEIIEHLLDKQGHELLNAGDFHSLHGARDLLFHVQEHRFTLPQISDICRELSLEFLGFEFANWRTRAAFRERYPKQGAERSLELWHEFEQANPLTFTGMYQFWVLKEPLG